MGQKVHPNGFRLGVIRDWNARWFASSREYAQHLNADLKLREFVKKRLANAAVSKITIERPAQNVNITVHTARPGIVIGKKGEDIDKLRRALTRMNGAPVQVAVEEVRKPEMDAQLVAESICQQLERRVMYRRAMKRAVQNAMRLGAKGVRIKISGRLNGAEIARKDEAREGSVPLHTLRADIDYGFAEANTTYGIIGVKVWVFNGEIFSADEQAEVDVEAAAAAAS